MMARCEVGSGSSYLVQPLAIWSEDAWPGHTDALR
jgi:hypothetical protein